MCSTTELHLACSALLTGRFVFLRARVILKVKICARLQAEMDSSVMPN